MVVRIAQLIAKHFFSVWNAIRKFLYIEIWLAGGRGSTKSSVISLAIVKGIIGDPMANAIVYRKHKVDIRDSVLEQMWWAICIMGVQDYFTRSDNPARIVYNPTGQQIRFRGLDDAKKSKSIKFAQGCARYLWFEEGDEYDGYIEVHSVIESVMRGHQDGKAIVFVSYNPPESANSWVNEEAAKPKPFRLVHRSTYLDVPREWNGEVFWRIAEDMKRTQPELYRHIYLGEITGTGGMIFKNVEVRRITAEERASFRSIRWGLDFGFENDPSVLTGSNIDIPRRTLYIFKDWSAHGVFEEQIFEQLEKLGLLNEVIIADSSEPRSIKRLQLMGARLIKKSYKSAGFPAEGVLFMRRLVKIVIDPYDAPLCAKEFPRYQFDQLRDGTFRNEYPDRDNHGIDGVRYSLENEIRFGLGGNHRLT